MWSLIKNEQVRNELFKDLEDFIKLVKKRGSFGACFLPDPFGKIVKAKEICIDGNSFKVIFATESYCYSIRYMTS